MPVKKKKIEKTEKKEPKKEAQVKPARNASASVAGGIEKKPVRKATPAQSDAAISGKHSDAGGSEKKAKYYYGLGKRKTAVAQAFLHESEKSTEANATVNGKKYIQYFPMLTHQNVVLAPLKLAGLLNKFEIRIKVGGGGMKGQAEAVRLAIARALIECDSSLKKSLKIAGYLTRDSRIVERKKPGLKKARRAPQWQKR